MSLEKELENICEEEEQIIPSGEECDEVLTPPQVYDAIKDNIVTLYDELTLLVNGQPSTGIDEDTGFLLPGGFVVVASFSVTILQTSGNIRVPPTQENVGPVRKGRTWVQVFNADGKGNSFVYETKLVGVDGVIGVGVLFIDMSFPWNKGLPKITPRGLKWGSNLLAKVGDPAYLAGLAEGIDYRAFSAGVIRNNRWTDLTGGRVIENVLLTITAGAGMSASPIVDKHAKVIGVGVQFGDQGQNIGFGPSQRFAEKVINLLIRSFEKGRPVNPSIVLVPDALGNYFVHIKAYAGLEYNVRYGSTFNGGAVFFTAPDACKTFVSQNPFGPVFKKSVGLFITGVDSAGGCNFSSTSGPSPFLGTISAGDLVTAITYKKNCHAKHEKTVLFGNLDNQQAPGNVTFFLLPGTFVTLTYFKQSENYSTEHKVSAFLKQYPAEFDSIAVTNVF